MSDGGSAGTTQRPTADYREISESLTSLLSSIKTASCVSLLCNSLTCLMGLVRASAYSENTHKTNTAE